MSRYFVGIPIPDEAALRIRLSIRRYRDWVPERLPRHRLHLTLFFLGDVEDLATIQEQLLAPIVSSFVPTVRLTHLGLGLAKRQLWAYVEPNAQLQLLHRTLGRRARELGVRPNTEDRSFVPHINVAKLRSQPEGEAVPDWPLLTTFSAQEAFLFESLVVDGSRRYARVAPLPLTAKKPVLA